MTKAMAAKVVHSISGVSDASSASTIQLACDKHGGSPPQWLPPTEIIRSRRISWFGHIARASRELDRCRALCAAIHGQPRDRKRQRAHTWTRTVEADLKPANIGLLSAWRRAQDRTAWSVLIRTVMPQSSFAPDDDNDDDDDGDDDDGGGGGGGSGGGVIYRFIINRD